jgi:hypothetical protein
MYRVAATGSYLRCLASQRSFGYGVQVHVGEPYEKPGKATSQTRLSTVTTALSKKHGADVVQ